MVDYVSASMRNRFFSKSSTVLLNANNFGFRLLRCFGREGVGVKGVVNLKVGWNFRAKATGGSDVTEASGGKVHFPRKRGGNARETGRGAGKYIL